jgi:hypothetical protein
MGTYLQLPLGFSKFGLCPETQKLKRQTTQKKVSILGLAGAVLLLSTTYFDTNAGQSQPEPGDQSLENSDSSQKLIS